MKIGGKAVNGPHECFLPLRDGEIIIRAKAVPNFKEFNALCPEPKPPILQTKDGQVPDTKDMNYRQVKAIHDEKFMAYMTIKSLEPSEIEWDTVKINEPATWTTWRKNLEDAGFAHFEINRIQNLVLEANCLDEDKLVQAREVFLRGQQKVQSESASPNSDQASS
jgi:hypothetical protein